MPTVLYIYLMGLLIAWGVAVAFCIESDIIKGFKEFIVPIIIAIWWPVALVAYLTLVILNKQS